MRASAAIHFLMKSSPIQIVLKIFFSLDYCQISRITRRDSEFQSSSLYQGSDRNPFGLFQDIMEKNSLLKFELFS